VPSFTCAEVTHPERQKEGLLLVLRAILPVAEGGGVDIAGARLVLAIS
jgi:hypothetical protein